MSDKAVIAVVEDDEQVRTFLERLLTRRDYRVLSFATAHEARETLTLAPPDLLILNNCEGCHVVSRENPNPYHPVEPGAILGTTITANDPLILTDDVAISPNAAVCSACHDSNLSKEHMIQNGGDFAAGKAADGTLISPSVETCTLCHGPGRSADVKEVHGVDQFQFN